MQNNPFISILQKMSMSNNPNAILESLVRQNPQIDMLFNQVRKSGMSMEQYARQLAKQNNINVDQLLRNLNIKP